MNKLLLIILMLIAVACSGGGGNPSTKVAVSTTGTATEEHTGEVRPYKEGIASYDLGIQRTVITSTSDYEFFYRMLTGDEVYNAEVTLESKDILMVVYSTKRFNIDNVTITSSSSTPNIYYYETDVEEQTPPTRYQLYTIEKTNNQPHYVQIVK